MNFSNRTANQQYNNSYLYTGPGHDVKLHRRQRLQFEIAFLF